MTDNNNPTTEELMSRMDAGEHVEVCGSPSSKEACLFTGDEGDDDKVYKLLHSIDDSCSFFSPSAMREVLDGKRDPWNGDVEDEDYPGGYRRSHLDEWADHRVLTIGATDPDDKGDFEVVIVAGDEPLTFNVNNSDDELQTVANQVLGLYRDWQAQRFAPRNFGGTTTTGN